MYSLFYAVEPSGYLLYKAQYLIYKLLCLFNSRSCVFFCCIVRAIIITLLTHCLKLRIKRSILFAENAGFYIKLVQNNNRALMRTDIVMVINE